jgi:CRP-like cAMP-binding protein
MLRTGYGGGLTYIKSSGKRREAKSRMATTVTPTGRQLRNRILAALLATEYKRLLPRLQHVSLKRGEIVYRADQEIEAVYFPEEAVVAMVDTAHDGRSVEVGVMGCEGIVGINIFLGGMTTPDKALVQLPGGAMRMRSADLRREVRFGSPLQRLLLDYTRTLLAVISKSVACSQHHSIEQRVARWLLTMSDYAAGREFVMVHASIAAMLGVRRVSVTEAASKLQADGLIDYSRGRIRVLDRPRLRRKSCACYRFIRQQYAGLQAALPDLLSRK